MQSPVVFIFGILGNLVAFSVYLAPAPTFYRIYKRKTTQEFQSVPYMIALLSCMIWIYYAIIKSNETLVITINSIGSLIEALYISIYITYASKNARIMAVNLLVLLNIVGFGSVLVLTQFLVKQRRVRVEVLGWISIALTATVYIAPLCIMKQVIRSKSVEFMPITLTLTLLLNAVIWFFYGLLLNDFFVTAPNIVGFIFAALQIILYLIYKNHKGRGGGGGGGDEEEEDNNNKQQLPSNIDLIKTTTLSADDHDHKNFENASVDPIQIITTLDAQLPNQSIPNN